MLTFIGKGLQGGDTTAQLLKLKEEFLVGRIFSIFLLFHILASVVAHVPAHQSQTIISDEDRVYEN